MGKKLSDEDFKGMVEKQVGEEYCFLEKYKTTDTKILVKHQECGNTYKVTPYHFLKRKQRCPKCNKYRKRTPKVFEKEFCKALGNEYELLSEYKGAKENITVRHKKCGTVYEQIASEAKLGKGCLKCAQKTFIGNRAKTPHYFRKEFNDIADGEYELLSEYKGDSEKVKIKHKKCGNVYMANAGAFLCGRRCPKCAIVKRSESQKWTHEKFLEVVNVSSDFGYIVLSNYINYSTKIKIMHKKCGHTYMVAPKDFISGRRCPRCRSSKGEEFIYSYLKENRYKFECQYKMEGCKSKRFLPFDFSVFLDEKIILIEYQGVQHYKPIDFFGGKKTFIERLCHDEIKKDFCEKNNIELIEIPYYYTKADIKKTLKNKLC